MDWMHVSSEGWLLAREAALGASDIQELLKSKEFSKNGKESFMTKAVGIWGDKHSKAPVVAVSYGPAARGHIMEPHAVAEYNNNRPASAVEMYHWDDVFIVGDNGLGFSPDAMDIEMPVDCSVELDASDVKPKEILEIKSYGSKNHVPKFLNQDKMKLQERYQVATAMYVCPSIEIGHLMFFDPGRDKFSMIWFDYTRSELAEELDTIGKVMEKYKEAADEIEATADFNHKALLMTEQEIFTEHINERIGEQ